MKIMSGVDVYKSGLVLVLLLSLSFFNFLVSIPLISTHLYYIALCYIPILGYYDTSFLHFTSYILFRFTVCLDSHRRLNFFNRTNRYHIHNLHKMGNTMQYNAIVRGTNQISSRRTT